MVLAVEQMDAVEFSSCEDRARCKCVLYGFFCMGTPFVMIPFKLAE